MEVTNAERGANVKERQRGAVRIIDVLIVLILSAILICVLIWRYRNQQADEPPAVQGSVIQDVDPLVYEEECREALKQFAQDLLKHPDKLATLNGSYNSAGLEQLGFTFNTIFNNDQVIGGLYFRPWQEVQTSKLPPDETWWAYEIYIGKWGPYQQAVRKPPFVFHRERCIAPEGTWCHVIMASGRVIASNVEGLKKRGIQMEPIVWIYE